MGLSSGFRISVICRGRDETSYPKEAPAVSRGLVEPLRDLKSGPQDCGVKVRITIS